MYHFSFLFEVLHKPTLLPSTFKPWRIISYVYRQINIKLVELGRLLTVVKSVSNGVYRFVHSNSLFDVPSGQFVYQF